MRASRSSCLRKFQPRRNYIPLSVLSVVVRFSFFLLFGPFLLTREGHIRGNDGRGATRNANTKKISDRRRKSPPQLAGSILLGAASNVARFRKFISPSSFSRYLSASFFLDKRTMPGPREIYSNARNDSVRNCDSGLNESSSNVDKKAPSFLPSFLSKIISPKREHPARFIYSLT